MQGFIKQHLIESFNDNFFSKDKNEVISEYKQFIFDTLGIVDFNTNHIEKLHDLGYLPLEIKALPEKSFIPCGIPCLTIVNTHPEHAWLVNFIETLMSTTLWIGSTSATTAYQYRQILQKYADKTLEQKDHWFIDYQAHDFSMRGMTSCDSAATSGAGHLQFFKGTDTIPAIVYLKDYYGVDISKGQCGTSVFATEHSVMCAGGKENEFETYKRLITEVYPSGIVSIVSDTWDLWNVLTDILPRLKNEILARDGKVVIRPDSGDPVDIICGKVLQYEEVNVAEHKGVTELLWETFGGTVNEKGYKVLNPKIGAIYGDSITLERCEEICKRLEEKGFASNSIVFGIGSYTYQHVTRDTYGFAMKATYCEVDGESRAIFKDPITQGNANKKSAKGLLKVIKDDGQYKLVDNVSLDEEKEGELKTVFLNGQFIS